MAISNGYMITSVGINVNLAPSCIYVDGVSIIDILEEKLVFINPKDVLRVLLENVERWFFNLDNDGFAMARSYWLRNIKEIKRKVTIKNGPDSVSGIFLDIDESGRLVLEHEAERLYISSGDLFVDQERVVVHNE
jgi:BirA family biotin operon repressor/biotin-[acetyl-CoA-carboxylase] ligase